MYRVPNCVRAFAALLPVVFAPHVLAELSYSLGERGLASLTYEGQEMLRQGAIKPVGHTPRLLDSGKESEPLESGAPMPSHPDSRRIALKYSWGTIECEYSQQGDRLRFWLRVTNSSPSATVQALDIDVAELTFGDIPEGRVLDAGMWGKGGTWSPLHVSSATSMSRAWTRSEEHTSELQSPHQIVFRLLL